MTSTQKQRIKNDNRIPKYEKLDYIIKSIREWDDDDCDFFHSEQFCKELINLYFEEEHNRCKVRSRFVNTLLSPIRFFQSVFDVFYCSKDK
jgi:hypothetical protein